MARKKVPTGKPDDPATPQDESVEEIEVPDVELTEEEETAAIVAAKVKKVADQAAAEAAAALEAEQAEATAQAEADAKDRQEHPINWIGLVMDGAPDPVYLKNVSEVNDRIVSHDNKRWEHVSDDTDGVWLYRHFR